MADLASFSLSDRRAAPHSRAHQYRLTAVSAVIQSAARLERGRTLNNVRGREGGREGGEGREGREGRGGRAGEGRGEGRASLPRAKFDQAGSSRLAEAREWRRPGDQRVKTKAVSHDRANAQRNSFFVKWNYASCDSNQSGLMNGPVHDLKGK